jgi:hypothetical protein
MKIVFKTFILLLLSSVLLGCGPKVDLIKGTKTISHNLTAVVGSIYIADFTDKKGETLLFQKYKSALENYFFGHGLRVVDDVNEADLVAFISYGIGSPIVNTYSVPVYSVTPARTNRSTSSVYSNQYGYIGYVTTTTHTMARYDKVGTKTKSYITYQRNFAMDILSVDAVTKEIPAKKVYEGRVKSIGSCNTVDEVMSELIQIMFQDFPGSQGTNEVQVISLTTPYCSKN